MAPFSRFRPKFLQNTIEDEGTSTPMTNPPSDKNNSNISGTNDAISPNNGNDEPAAEQAEKDVLPTEDAQRGVQQVEAVTLTWTKPYLITVFILYAPISPLSLITC